MLVKAFCVMTDGGMNQSGSCSRRSGVCRCSVLVQRATFHYLPQGSEWPSQIVFNSFQGSENSLQAPIAYCSPNSSLFPLPWQPLRECLCCPIISHIWRRDVGYLLALTYWVRVLLEEYDSAQLMAIMCIFMYSAGQNTLLMNSVLEGHIHTYTQTQTHIYCIHRHSRIHILTIYTHTEHIIRKTELTLCRFFIGSQTASIISTIFFWIYIMILVLASKFIIQFFSF